MSEIPPHHQIDEPQKQQVLAFILESRLSDFPEQLIDDARYAILDLLAVASVGQTTKTAAIICDYAASALSASSGSPSAPILCDGRPVSPAGAALAGGMMIDSIDAHDGYKPVKGHIGCALLPSICAGLMARDGRLDDTSLLEAMIIGYEVGGRCGEALHATVPDYHTSGAWMAVAVAAVEARISGLSADQSWEAMGIAEYHGPRSQMMRVIDYASMLKDGSGWGAFAGMSAAALAKSGFTGAPAITVGARAVSSFWSDLGTRWIGSEQYFKPWPVCRWAQPAMQATADILDKDNVPVSDIASVRIDTFHQALRLASPHPSSPDEAQYSICWPVAAQLIAAGEGRGFSAYDVSDEALSRDDIHQLSDRITLVENDKMNDVFPQLRQSRVTITLTDGRQLSSYAEHTYGDPETPVSQQDRVEKFDLFLAGSPQADHTESLKDWCLSLGQKRQHPDATIPVETYLFPGRG